MRGAIFLIAALIGGSLAGCGPEPVAAPAHTASPPAFSAPVSTAQPLGAGQDIRAPELAARVTVTGTLSSADRYAVKVTVQVLRGTYEFGPATVRLHHADGPDTAPSGTRAVPPVAYTLHAGVTQAWEIPFGAAAGRNAQVQIVTPSGVVLAWTAR
ncbi:hypothetical protein [Actinoplanes sp. NPDC020271]|uniref:hypothetical protein n=1 Tax=Actinoplanes sp. NPDC020271 TaxID=3363896 RepID=UPI0037A06334